MKLNFLIVLIVCIASSACEENNFHFNNPQPEDSKNTYTIPSKYRGTWQIDSDKKSISTITIGKDYYTTIEKKSNKESKTELELDSNVYFVGDKAYLSDEGKLLGAFDYIEDGDSLILEYKNVKTVEFGQKAFLRKFDYGYLLNLKIDGMNDWYNVHFIDTRNKEGIFIREIGKEDLDGKNNYEILDEDFNEFLITQWTKQDFQNFIDNGGFSRELVFLKYEDRNKN